MAKSFNIEAITPSDQTKKVCKQLGITVIDINEAQDVTIAFDGCDEVDSNLNALKHNPLNAHV